MTGPARRPDRVRLHKLHATGNDFLVVDATAWAVASGDSAAGTAGGDPTALPVSALCDRRRGVGADGLILLTEPRSGHGPTDPSSHPAADAGMVLVNADGARAEMSGNGIRALAWLAHRLGRGDGQRLLVDTDAGRRTIDVDVAPETGEVRAATVDMGPVTFDPARIPLDAPSAFDLDVTVDGAVYRGDAAGMGNPHLVLFVEDPDRAPVERDGPRLEHDPRFPNRTNIEFAAVDDGRGAGAAALHMRVWERGVGETLSCGTGACAAAAVAHRRGLVPDRVDVHVPGGVLSVSLAATVRLGGPVVHVFDTDVDLAEFEEGS